MATYGKGFSVSAAVSASGSSLAAVYTVPASSFAIVNVTGTGSVTVDGRVVTISAGAIYMGPGQTITTSGGGTIVVSGVQFTNS